MTSQSRTINYSGGRIAAISALLAVWFAGAYFIGVERLLVNTNADLVPPIALSVAVPIVGFLFLYAASARFRRFVLAHDMETLTMLQHWRVIGFGFLLLYFYDVLPALFAWPAGVGDLAIGLAAPFVVARLRRDSEFASSAGLRRFHYLGLLDFVLAVVTAGLASGAFPALIPSGLTSAPMDVWPLNLFPSFMVPIFVILHLTVIFKLRELRRQSTHGAVSALRTA